MPSYIDHCTYDIPSRKYFADKLHNKYKYGLIS